MTLQFSFSVSPLRCITYLYNFLNEVTTASNLKHTERSFKHCAPGVWNKLPCELRTCPEVTIFKQKLKTHLFTKAFEHLWCMLDILYFIMMFSSALSVREWCYIAVWLFSSNWHDLNPFLKIWTMCRFWWLRLNWEILNLF